MIYLSEEAKIGLVSGAIGILVLMVTCMICKLNKLKKSSLFRSVEYLPLHTDQMFSDKQPVSDCSDCTHQKTQEMIEVRSRKPSPYHGLPNRYGPNKSKGEINFLLTYFLNEQKLQVNIIEAKHLVGKDFWETVDSYVKVRLHPDKKGDQKYIGDVFRKSSNPSYNQIFELTVSQEELTGSTLQVSVWEIDKYSRHRNIGQTNIELRQLDKLNEPVPFLKELVPVHKVSSTAERDTKR